MTLGKDLKLWEIADMNDTKEASAKVRTYGRMNARQRANWDAAYGPKNQAFIDANTPQDWRDSFYYHYYEGGGHHVPRHYGITDGKRKLIHYYTLDEWEYFDIEKDPDETNSLYANPEHRAEVTEMKAKLKAQQVQIAVTLDTKPLKEVEKGWLAK
jgi:hypothetical protein